MAKQAAYGTILRYTDPDDASKVRIQYVADISGPSLSVETVDVTTHDSPDHFNEFLPGMADGGEVTFDLVFDSGPEGHARLLELQDARKILGFDLLVPQVSELVPDPTLTVTSAWTLGTNWAAGSGTLDYSGTAVGTEKIQMALAGLVAGETYQFTITRGNAGSGTFVAAVGGVSLGTFVPGGGTSWNFTYVHPEGGDGTAVFDIHPQASVTSVTAHITGISILGLDATKGKYEFDALITKVGPKFEVKDAIRASCSLKVSGDPEWTPLS